MSTFDDYALLRRQEQAAQDTDDAELTPSHQAIQQGMSNKGLWFWLGLGLALMPFTWGASFLLSLWAGYKMSGGQHMVTDALPQAADAAAPGWGCARILASLVCLVLLAIGIVFVAMLVLFETGAIG